nr:hypothetical protein [Actinomadura madurae]
MRAAEPVRDAEPLRGADRDVRAGLARRAQQRQREQVGGHDRLGAALARPRDQGLQVADGAGRARVLQQDSEEVAVREPPGQVRGDHLDAERDRARPDDLDRLRQRVGVDEERPGLLAPGRAVGQGHGLGGGGALVQHGGVRDRQPGQVGDDRLEVQQGLQPPCEISGW